MTRGRQTKQEFCVQKGLLSMAKFMNEFRIKEIKAAKYSKSMSSMHIY
jgi:hypothetical protein